MSPILGSIGGLSARGFGFKNLTASQFTLTGSYDALGVVKSNGSVNTITFSSIPQTGYRNLQLRIMAQDVRSGQASDTMQFYYNNDSTGTNYTRHRLLGNGSAASASSVVATSGEWNEIGLITGGATTTGIMGVSIVEILDYTDTNKNKVMRALYGFDSNGTGRVALGSGIWMNTSAINRIDIINNGSSAFTADSVFALYGER